MAAIATLLVVLTLSLLCVRVATVMLILTGLSLPLARFQARSAFTGCGFTTGESEKLVNHPVRRRIISTLMLLGNAGIVTTVGTLLAGLTNVRGEEKLVPGADGVLTIVQIDPSFGLYQRLGLLFAGIIGLWAVSSSKYLERLINRATVRLLRKYTSLEVRDYANLMHLSGAYGINELAVEKGDWLADKPLSQLKLTHEGVVVLGVQRGDGSYLGAPEAATTAHVGDTMIVYGRVERLKELDGRRADRAGVLKHVEAVVDQRVRVLEEREEDAEDEETKHTVEQARKRAEAERDALREHVASVADEPDDAVMAGGPEEHESTRI